MQDSNIDIVEVGLCNTCTIVALSPDWNCLEMVADSPNMDVAVIMTSYGCCLFGGRPVKTAVRFIPEKSLFSDDDW